jgi:hypothetical protein
MKIKIGRLRSIIQTIVNEAKITKSIDDPINGDPQMRKLFMGLFEQYKKMLVNQVLAMSSEQFTAASPEAGVRVEKGVEPGQYDQEFVKRVGEMVDDKVDLMFGPIAQTLIKNWKSIASEIVNAAKPKAKPKPAQPTAQATAAP